MNRAVAKSLLIWLCILPLGILNGGLRESVLRPLLGDVALPLSGVLLALLIFALAYLLVPRLGAQSKPTYVKIGGLWVLLTVAAEALIGIVMGNSRDEIIRNYGVSGGNLWIFVVILTGFLPTIVSRMKRLV